VNFGIICDGLDIQYRVRVLNLSTFFEEKFDNPC